MGANPITGWDAAVAFALTLPDTELSKTYGKPAVKLASNGRTFLFVSREPDSSFGIMIDHDTAEMLMDTGPETFWQSAHYQGWSAMLIRYDSPDPERVRRVIAQARDWNAARKPAKPRKG